MISDSGIDDVVPVPLGGVLDVAAETAGTDDRPRAEIRRRVPLH